MEPASPESDRSQQESSDERNLWNFLSLVGFLFMVWGVLVSHNQLSIEPPILFAIGFGLALGSFRRSRADKQIIPFVCFAVCTLLLAIVVIAYFRDAFRI